MNKTVISLILLAFGASASARNIRIQNNCDSDISVGTHSNPDKNNPIEDAWGIGAGDGNDVDVDDDWAGNFYCNDSPGSLAEFALLGWEGIDSYDISLVDGASIGIQIAPDNDCQVLTCGEAPCEEGYNFDKDDDKTNGCEGAPNYTITYCP